MDHLRNTALALALLGVAACASQDPPVDAKAAPGVTAMATPTGAAAADPVPSELPAPDVPPVATPGPGEAPPAASSLRGYFNSEPLASASKAFHAGSNDAAARAFAVFVAQHPDDARAKPARFLNLLARHDGGDTLGLGAALTRFATAWPLLSDYAHFYAGSAHAQQGELESALAALARVSDDAVVKPRAEELAAKLLLDAGRMTEGDKRLAALVAADGAGRSSAFDLALERAGDDEAKMRTLKVRAATRFAGTTYGGKMRRAVKDSGLSGDERYALGKALAKANVHTAAIEQLKGVKKTHAAWCDAKYLIARAWEKKKKRARAWKAFEQALTCKGQTLGDATFAGGRNRFRAGEHKQAQALLRQHIKDFSGRTTVDDAQLILAKSLRETGDTKGADAALTAAASAKPPGDMADEAAWQLVWTKIDAGQHEAALGAIDRVLATRPREASTREQGKLRYWRGVLLGRLKRAEEARGQWRQVVREFPLSWYAVLAYSRLKAHDPAAAEAEIALALKLTTPPPDVTGPVPARLWQTPAFVRAVEFIRMGLMDSARRELDTLPRRRDDGARAEAWALSTVYQNAGAWHLGARLANKRERYFNTAWPKDHHAEVWKLAHPKAFEPLVTAWAKERDIDAHWIWGVMKTESNYNPRVTSWAGAHGLMQIIMPTAKFLAKGTDITPTRAKLLEPEVALELGTKYLKKLLGQHKSIPLASAGYNAGGGSVKRWRRQFGKVELDEFVERIPYREARKYARRVTETAARYKWLYDGAMMALDLSPPGPP